MVEAHRTMGTPSQRGAQQAQRLAGAGWAFEQRIVALGDGVVWR